MPDPVLCPLCEGSLTQVGQYWICAQHGQVALEQFSVRRRVFISYGHDEHASLAERLNCDLKARGHQTWFDRDRLQPGQDWAGCIEEGFDWLSEDRANSAMVLLLTPYSARRPQGFCLREIHRAQARDVAIIPLMVVDCEPPIEICHLLWLDMRECIPISEKEALYAPSFGRLLQALEEKQVTFEGSQQRLKNCLQPPELEFHADLKMHREGFIGREWVFEAVDAWLAENHPRQRVFWILGGPGVGKTALSAMLSSRYLEIAALHLCRIGHAQKSDPRRVVTSLAYQLSTQLPEYAAQLATMDLERLVRDGARALFDNLLVQQLAKLPERAHPVVMLIDALDEAGVEERNELAEFIAAEFPRTPPWLRLMITSRPEEAVTAPLQTLHPFTLDAATEANRRDIHDYLRQQLTPLLDSRPDAESLIEHIVERSEGLFLYAECICQDLRQGDLSLDRLEQFPQGLGGVFWNALTRQFPAPDRFRRDVRPALRAILAAREPLPVATLQRLFNWQDEEVADFTRTLGSLFPVSVEGGQEVIRPYHRSLAEWLADRARAKHYFVSAQEGHRLLASHYRRAYEQDGIRADASVLRHILTHLRLAGEIDRVFCLTADDDFLSRFLVLSSPEALRREMASSWAGAVARGTEAAVAENHPTTAFLAHGLHLAERGDYAEAIRVLRDGVPDRVSTMAMLAWTELCWLAKDHLPPAEARVVIEEGARHLSEALAGISDAAHGVLCAEVARTIGWMLKDLGLADESCAAFQMAVTFSEQLEDPRQLAWSSRDLGCWYRDAHDFEPARTHLTSSVAAFRELGDDRHVAISLKDLGLLELEQTCAMSPAPDDRVEAALTALQESVRLAGAIGDADLAAWTERYLGIAEARGGQGEAGRHRIERVADHFRDFHDTNVMLSQFCAQHAGHIRRPCLIERLGHSHQAEADFRELLR